MDVSTTKLPEAGTTTAYHASKTEVSSTQLGSSIPESCAFSVSTTTLLPQEPEPRFKAKGFLGVSLEITVAGSHAHSSKGPRAWSLPHTRMYKVFPAVSPANLSLERSARAPLSSHAISV